MVTTVMDRIAQVADIARQLDEFRADGFDDGEHAHDQDAADPAVARPKVR